MGEDGGIRDIRFLYPFGKVGFALNVKTQRVLFSILAIVLVAGILFAIYFTSQPDGNSPDGEVSNGSEVSDDGKGPLVDFDHENASLVDKLVFGLETTGLGMGIVFAVLVILWGAIALVSKIVGGESAPKAAPAQTAQPAQPVQQPQTAAADESEFVAVCTAAIAASRGETDCAFNVISITEIK